MWNAIPVVGWLIAGFFITSLAVPAWFLWNWLVPIYVPTMPALYLNLPFWHIVGIFWLVSILKAVFLPHFNISSSCEKAKK